jgi:hypothetical protein
VLNPGTLNLQIVSTTVKREPMTAFHSVSNWLTDVVSTSIPPASRLVRLNDVGQKACGLLVLPRAWTPPFVVIKTEAYRVWRPLEAERRRGLLSNIGIELLSVTSSWLSDWPAGLMMRSSATSETLNERGANATLELAADCTHDHFAQAITDIFSEFSSSGQTGEIAIVVQARVAVSRCGHLSNEVRISKTVNQWLCETTEPQEDESRFNSQRSQTADPMCRLVAGTRKDLITSFRRVGRWCTELKTGRTHLEWGWSQDHVLWILQLDFEVDQPDLGQNPDHLLRGADRRPPSAPPIGSPLRIADISSATGWPKIDKVTAFQAHRAAPYPKLHIISGVEVRSA